LLSWAWVLSYFLSAPRMGHTQRPGGGSRGGDARLPTDLFRPFPTALTGLTRGPPPPPPPPPRRLRRGPHRRLRGHVHHPPPPSPPSPPPNYPILPRSPRAAPPHPPRPRRDPDRRPPRLPTSSPPPWRALGPPNRPLRFGSRRTRTAPFDCRTSVLFPFINRAVHILAI